MKLTDLVYFVQNPDTGLIKIGTSHTTPIRMRALAVQEQANLKILGVVTGSYQTEKMLHQYFAHLKEHGEWFRPDNDLLDYIANEVLPPPFELVKQDWDSPLVVRKVNPSQGLRRYTPPAEIGAILNELQAFYECDRDWLITALVIDAHEDVRFKMTTGDTWIRRSV